MSIQKNKKILIEHKDGFWISKDDAAEEVVPLECPICNFLMKDSQDVLSFRNSGCCGECELRWVEPDEAAWEAGQRPTKKDLAIEKRKRRNVPSYIATLCVYE
jgi:hypothetical protein